MRMQEILITNAGKIIRRHRKLNGLSMEELANRSGIHDTHLGNIERGNAAMTLPTLFKISAGLDLSPSTLLKDIEEDTFTLYEEDMKERT
ncbi:XRE family transcriptional regulator [Bacillus salacetis]|uniref:XRE family transcriptional regulator n=1 Tax=Bacillus salacetis TaxID=2315464 RepID=A0A3A1QTG6_9BACI|nr:helix-turn-helix transcriptional regulator [Bacillus salacetis]RIW30709.1 XRE family transcriptional regulator [Bacillus salacetis]